MGRCLFSLFEEIRSEKTGRGLWRFECCASSDRLEESKINYNKTPGYTQAEIDGMTTMIEAGFVDTFRTLYPDTVKYSWWSYRGGARAKNVGWRLDYSWSVQDSWPSTGFTNLK